MKNSLIEIKNKFNLISKMGYVKSVNNNNSGIGLTFEKLLGKEQDEFSFPDYKGIEIKTRRAYRTGYTTLFNSIPDNEVIYEMKRIKDTYGYPDYLLKEFKVFRGSVYGNKISPIGMRYMFKLDVDRVEEKVYLCIYDIYENLIERKVYWSFNLLKEILERKLNYLAVVKAWPNKINGDIYFKYYKIDFYKFKNFETFIGLIEKGNIRVNFKIGVFRGEFRHGQIHDHGTGFEIMDQDLPKLFDSCYI